MYLPLKNSTSKPSERFNLKFPLNFLEIIMKITYEFLKFLKFMKLPSYKNVFMKVN